MAASLADRLQEYRAQQPLQPLPLELLLRDLIFVLQGIDGQYVRFKAPTRASKPVYDYAFHTPAEWAAEEERLNAAYAQGGEQGIVFDLRGQYSLAAPTRDLVHALAELGWLYNKINVALKRGKAQLAARGGVGGGGRDKEGAREIGMVEQALHAALQTELTEYYRLVAVLQGQLGKTEQKSKMTLRRLLVWTEEVMLRMRMMGVLVGQPQDQSTSFGGALLTSLHAYTSHGDPFIRTFSSRLLTTVSVPFFTTLSAWIYDGSLVDPYSEFFVQLNQGVFADERRGDLLSLGQVGEFGGQEDSGQKGARADELWKSKFKFRKEMLPGFLEESFGRKIFSTGKSLNFIKYSCQDSDWVDTQKQLSGAGKVLEYSDMAGLERSISLAYSIASQRLFDIYFDKFRLLDHLTALKDYLMLGKGDFVEILMEGLGPSLSKPANTLYRHHLTTILETAIRGSTSTSSGAEVIRRLDVRMQDFSAGQIGWDVFTLEYKVDSPLDTVLDPRSMEAYQKMFNHLWNVKRVEYACSAIWRRLMTGARTFLRVPSLSGEFHQTRIALAEMVHFIRQLQYYCHLEVIACSWQALEEFAKKKEGDLDGLIAAHETYLDRLVSKALLMNPKKGPEDSVLKSVREIFQLILDYRDAADGLCNYALSEAARTESYKDAGRGLASNAAPPTAARLKELNGITDRLAKYAEGFRDAVQELVVTLAQAPDLDQRFLSVRLNWSGKYIQYGDRRKGNMSKSSSK